MNFLFKFVGTSEKAIEATGSALDFTSLITSIVSIGNSLPLRVDLTSKIIQRTRFFKINYSDELRNTFKTLQTTAIKIPAPSSIDEKIRSKNLPGVFAQYNISPSF